ncbi:insulin gene enhancer protein ISL-3 isoform X1, partial [Lates japonicus]
MQYFSSHLAGSSDAIQCNRDQFVADVFCHNQGSERCSGAIGESGADVMTSEEPRVGPCSLLAPLSSPERHKLSGRQAKGQSSPHIFSASTTIPFILPSVVMQCCGLFAEKPGFAMCVGCGSQIHDQYILRVSPDLEWHAACLKCAECSQYLDETCTCFVRDGKTYCKRDYVRLFGIKCAKCNLGFSSSDLVMRARDNVYHIECFRCSVCSRQLLPGDEFSLREEELLCRADHSLLLERSSTGSPISPGHIHSNRPLHLAADPVTVRQAPHRNHVHKQSEKTTRVRTVLNEKQLHTLRTCYNANPRPDALMKEQLVEMTGLSPRVIRVWFQNKRCKDKKKSILMKQLQQQQHSDKTVSIFNLQGLTGTPLVAGSPIRHESTVQGNPVEVQTYQPPWKAL